MTVLFIHGLESGPGGTKVRRLRELGFEVAAEDMHMSVRRWTKRNSVIRSLVRSPEPVALTLGVVAATAVACLGWGSVGLLVLAIWPTWAALRWRRWFGQALGRSRERCVQVQREALRTHQPAVVIGSSWGGAVLAELIAEGAWTGPTVLLAPAIRRAQLAIDPDRYPALVKALRAHGRRAPVHVFHDPEDPVVPYQGSLDLAQGGDVHLHPVPGGGHRLLPVLELPELQALLTP
ncbi:MAG: hypothetical protein KTR31_23105 [Myxococcales bacterium]|nr:hypothetical protein [Myxococcales bacterium]